MRETPVRESKAERRARAVLERNGVQEPPVPVDELAATLGIAVVDSPTEEDVAGVLHCRRDGASMIVNGSPGSPHRRFTVAHQIGHFLLHRGEIFLDKRLRVHLREDDEGLAPAFEEIQANQFAAELLMPRDWLVTEASRQLTDWKNASAQGGRRKRVKQDLIEELATHFDVSREAVEYRLANLGLWGPL